MPTQRSKKGGPVFPSPRQTAKREAEKEKPAFNLTFDFCGAEQETTPEPKSQDEPKSDPPHPEDVLKQIMPGSSESTITDLLNAITRKQAGFMFSGVGVGILLSEHFRKDVEDVEDSTTEETVVITRARLDYLEGTHDQLQSVQNLYHNALALNSDLSASNSELLAENDRLRNSVFELCEEVDRLQPESENAWNKYHEMKARAETLMQRIEEQEEIIVSIKEGAPAPGPVPFADADTVAYLQEENKRLSALAALAQGGLKIGESLTYSDLNAVREAAIEKQAPQTVQDGRKTRKRKDIAPASVEASQTESRKPAPILSVYKPAGKRGRPQKA